MEGRGLEIYFHTSWDYGDSSMTCGYIGVDSLDNEEVISGLKEYDLTNRLKLIDSLKKANKNYKSLNKFHCGLGCIYFSLEDIFAKFNDDEIDLLDYNYIVFKNQENYTLDLIFNNGNKKIDISYERGITNVLKQFSNFYEVHNSLEFYGLKINGKDNIAKKVLDKKLKSLSNKATKISKSKVLNDLEKEGVINPSTTNSSNLKSSFSVLDTMIDYD